MKVMLINLSLLVSLMLTGRNTSNAQQVNMTKKSETIIPLEQFVGYYQVGVKPNRPFFRSRWYLRDGRLFTIYDSDRDRELVPYENGKLAPTIFLNEEAVEIKENDSTYYLLLNFKEDQLQSFQVIRPRSEWPTDLYGYRIKQLDEMAIDTEKKLTYHYETTHFKFNCNPLDSAQIPQLGSYLEHKIKPTLDLFNLEMTPQIKIRIYPDYETYHNAVLTPGAPKWQRGRAWDDDEIRMLSPITVQREAGEEIKINEVVFHELIHCMHLNMINDGVRVPGWLWEGVALYKGCCRWVENPMELDYIKKGKRPSLKQIENDRSGEIKYDLGYFIIEFLEDRYGWDKILQLIKKNGQIKEVLGISSKKFTQEFYDFLEEKY